MLSSGSRDHSGSFNLYWNSASECLFLSTLYQQKKTQYGFRSTDRFYHFIKINFIENRLINLTLWWQYSSMLRYRFCYIKSYNIPNGFRAINKIDFLMCIPLFWCWMFALTNGRNYIFRHFIILGSIDSETRFNIYAGFCFGENCRQKIQIWHYSCKFRFD